MNKKSQQAMEFLMTYGWGILVVLVAIGTWAYFDLLTPDNFKLKCGGVWLPEIKNIALEQCQANIKADDYTCNEEAKILEYETYLEIENCNPVCIVDTVKKEAFVEYRCD